MRHVESCRVQVPHSKNLRGAHDRLSYCDRKCRRCDQPDLVGLPVDLETWKAVALPLGTVYNFRSAATRRPRSAARRRARKSACKSAKKRTLAATAGEFYRSMRMRAGRNLN